MHERLNFCESANKEHQEVGNFFGEKTMMIIMSNGTEIFALAIERDENAIRLPYKHAII